MPLSLLRAPCCLGNLLIYGSCKKEHKEQQGALLEQELTPEQLQAAEKQFQDELIGEGMAWFSFFMRLVYLLYVVQVIGQMMFFLAWHENRDHIGRRIHQWYESIQTWIGLVGVVTMSLVWAACGYVVRQTTCRCATKRLMLCISMPLFCMGSLAQHRNVRMLILHKLSGTLMDWVGVDYGSLFLLMYTLSFWIMLVAPSNPGIKVGISSLFLFCAVLFLTWLEAPDVLFIKGEVYQTFLAVGFLIAVLFIKRSKERIHRDFVLALHYRSTQVVSEKVERCRAEFRIETLREKLQNKQATNVESEAQSRGTSQCRSVMTAPAATWTHLGEQAARGVQAGPDGSCMDADCLPENSLVQVEGGIGPQELGSVQVGDRVLCTDNLHDRTGYVSVVNMDFVDDEDPSAWVRLRLSDGTFITMTGDHPLRVRCRQNLDSVKPAAEVRPQRDSVLCLRLVQQTIEAVERDVAPLWVSHGRGGMAGPPRRVALTVEHGTRFSVLVSPAGSPSPISDFTAVGSADAQFCGFQRNSKWEYGYQGPLSQGPALRRSNSEPALATIGGGAAAAGAEARTTTAPHDAQCDFVDIEQLLASLTEGCSRQLAGLVMENRESLGLDLEEFWSRGCALHGEGRCRPCNRTDMKGGCFRGQDCEYCHIPHPRASGGSRKSRPNANQRDRLRRFSDALGGMFKSEEGAWQVAVRQWAARDHRFEALLRQHAAALLAASAAASSPAGGGRAAPLASEPGAASVRSSPSPCSSPPRPSSATSSSAGWRRPSAERRE